MATLHRLTVRGFKSIRSLEEFEVRGVNVLIGANGAGKSNLLDVFRSVSELAGGRWQVHVEQEGGADALLYGGRRKTPRLEIALSFDRGHYYYSLSAEAAGDDLVLGREWLSPGAAQEAEPVTARRLLSGRSSGWSGTPREAIPRTWLSIGFRRMRYLGYGTGGCTTLVTRAV